MSPKEDFCPRPPPLRPGTAPPPRSPQSPTQSPEGVCPGPLPQDSESREKVHSAARPSRPPRLDAAPATPTTASCVLGHSSGVETQLGPRCRPRALRGRPDARGKRAQRHTWVRWPRPRPAPLALFSRPPPTLGPWLFPPPGTQAPHGQLPCHHPGLGPTPPAQKGPSPDLPSTQGETTGPCPARVLTHWPPPRPQRLGAGTLPAAGPPGWTPAP